MSKVNDITVTVKRQGVKTPDGAGGYTQTLGNVTGSPFAAGLIRRVRPKILEESSADFEVAELVIRFPVGSDIRMNDICVLPNLGDARVEAVRTYLRSVQADVRLIR